MREIERIILILAWSGGLALLLGIGWAIYHWDLFPRKRLRNTPFEAVKIGQTFFDYGGEDLQLREYQKTDELEAKCLSVPGQPLVAFEKKAVVKTEVLWNLRR